MEGGGGRGERLGWVRGFGVCCSSRFAPGFCPVLCPPDRCFRLESLVVVVSFAWWPCLGLMAGVSCDLSLFRQRGRVCAVRIVEDLLHVSLPRALRSAAFEHVLPTATGDLLALEGWWWIRAEVYLLRLLVVLLSGSFVAVVFFCLFWSFFVSSFPLWVGVSHTLHINARFSIHLGRLAGVVFVWVGGWAGGWVGG